jgi:hypothetical protein
MVLVGYREYPIGTESRPSPSIPSKQFCFCVSLWIPAANGATNYGAHCSPRTRNCRHTGKTLQGASQMNRRTLDIAQPTTGGD